MTKPAPQPVRSDVALVWRPVVTLAQRELQRFYRQRDRVVGAVAQPIVFWLLFGSGLSASFRPAGVSISSMEFFLPGTVVMIVLFTAIFSTVSVIEDRNEGFLQGVLAAPVKRSSIIAGKVLGGVLLAVPQGLLVLLLGPLVGAPFRPASFLAGAGVLTLVAIALTGLGLCIAWRMDSIQGFHAIMTVFLFPMWILSGAFFPQAGAPTWLSGIMTLNPLTYGVAALRRALYFDQPDRIGDVPGLTLALAVTILFGLVTFVQAVRLANRPATGKKAR